MKIDTRSAIRRTPTIITECVVSPHGTTSRANRSVCEGSIWPVATTSRNDRYLREAATRRLSFDPKAFGQGGGHLLIAEIVRKINFRSP
jgi:hypothetical protein